MLTKNSIRNSVSPHNHFYHKQVKDYSYFSQDLIGNGYSSAVYRATNDSTGHTVALKIINLRSMRDQLKKKLLRMQLECLKSISHPNILKFIQSFDTMNNCYIVTEYCNGSDLEKYLKKKGRLSENEVMKIFWQVYCGYQHLSSSGYIHRDIKPANIFFQNQKVRIADFGFAKRNTGNQQEIYNVGTTVYMSPESLNANIYNQKADIWSLGVMCFELIHGRIPWYAKNQYEMKKQISTMTPVINKQLVSSDFYDFIMNCLQPNPYHRISLKQMKSHPWMMKAKNYFHSQFNQKHTQIHSGVLRQNKNFMFNILNLPSNNQMAKMQTIIPQNIRKDEHQNNWQNLIAQQDKENKHYKNNTRQLIDSISYPQANYFEDHQQTSSKGFQKNNKNTQKVLQSLISILNFHRFQFKVFEFVDKSKNIFQKQKIKSIILTNLLFHFSEQQKLLQTEANIHDIDNWKDFIGSSQWNIYKKVIRQYSIKYRDAYFQLHVQYQPLSMNQFLLKHTHFILENEKYNHNDLQCLQYLYKISNTSTNIVRLGWSGYLQNYKIFIQEISERKAVNDQNQKQSLANIKRQCEKLKLSYS